MVRKLRRFFVKMRSLDVLHSITLLSPSGQGISGYWLLVAGFWILVAECAIEKWNEVIVL